MRLTYLLLVALVASLFGHPDALLHHEDHHLAAQAAPAELFLPSFAGFSSFAVQGQAKRLAGLGYHFLVLQTNTEVFASGYNYYRQLATGAITETALTPQKANVTGVVDVAAGALFSCLVVGSTTRQVQCVGHGQHGQLGRGSVADSPELQPVSGPVEGVSEVFCGYSTAFAISAGGGQVYAWGRNDQGQLGDGGGAHAQSVPKLVNLTIDFNATQVGAGFQHSCFLSSAGEVRCAGQNGQGQLGNGGSVGSTNTPVAVDISSLSSPAKFVAVATGDYHACATATDIEVYCWGRNLNYQLGSRDGTQNKPTPVADISNARSVWAGADNTFVIDNSTLSGAVAFGQDQYGVFGLGSLPAGVKSATPLVFGHNVTGIMELRGGFMVTCILKQSGEVWCTGYGYYGQLGLGGCKTDSLTLVEWGETHTCQPTASPTSSQPTFAPTSAQPTSAPTSSMPTMNPTSSQPTGAPSKAPTFSPTSSIPSKAPTSLQPTNAPTHSPTSSIPTRAPVSSAPSGAPTQAPVSSVLTAAPVSGAPTTAPVSGAPTAAPLSGAPTGAPVSGAPSAAPLSSAPTTAPLSGAPTSAPISDAPTAAPLSGTPTSAPISGAPTAAPFTAGPTFAPVSTAPSTTPISKAPSAAPASAAPSTAPISGVPTAALASITPTTAPSTSPVSATSTPTPPANPNCRPIIGTDKNACAKLTKKCAKSKVTMFWAGAGCRVNGKLQYDGGCQCKDYCGYTCSKACMLSSGGRCKWNKTLKVCMVAKTKKPYVPRDTAYCPQD